MQQDEIPVSEQANVPSGLMSLNPGTVPGKRPPNFGREEYQSLADVLADQHVANLLDYLGTD